MENFLIYLLKASIGIFLFYSLYYLVLRKETYYTSNRLFLLFGLFLAILLPAMPISYETPVAFISNSQFFSLNENTPGEISILTTEESGSISFWDNPILILSTVYLIGAGFFLLRLAFQTLYVTLQMRHGKRLVLHDVSVIDIHRKINPFSFFNHVIINIKAYSEDELSNILAHEKVHIQERHWIDLLVIELLTVVFWMNPIVWLYERSIKQNHEYLADQGVLLAGYHPGNYQALLINQLLGVKILGFTNNLNFSLNKKRMEMMKKEKSPGFNKVKLLIALPVIAGLIFAFAKKEYVMVEPEAAQVEEQSNINLNYSTTEFFSVKGKVADEAGNPMTGANVLLHGTSNGTVVDLDGEFVLKVPKLVDKKGVVIPEGNGYMVTIVTSFVGYRTHVNTFNRKTIDLLDITLEKRAFNIKLPDTNDPNFKMQLPPPPPPKRSEDWKGDIYVVVEQMPYYENGGMSRLALDIKKEVDWVLEKTNDRGEAIVGFTVSANGKIVNPHITKSANSKMLDASAVKIITKLDNWWAGMQRGKRVPVDLAVPLKFE